MAKFFDEITGLWIDEPELPTTDFWIVDTRTATSHARADTKGQAKELQMQLGLRARTKIIEVS